MADEAVRLWATAQRFGDDLPMGHFAYAREGDVIYRFDDRPSRDDWVCKGATRRAIAASEIPLRLKTGRSIEGLELRDGHNGMPTRCTWRMVTKSAPAHRA